MVKKPVILAVLLVFVIFAAAQNRQFNSTLPLVFIDTNGRQIPDEPKIMASMGVIWNGDGNMNHTGDPFNHYDGYIAIETRGSSSQGFPKKSYGFETRDEAGEDIDFPLLGLPEEEDWIFYGPYSDKSLIRNALTFTLAQSLGHYASRIRFVELFLNNQYQGIYVLMEKIKRDKVRVDIARLRPEETSGIDLTGGYIIKIDKTTGSRGPGWDSKYRNSNNQPTHYQFEVPAHDEIVGEQKNYIKKFVDEFEDAVYYKRFRGAGSYTEYIDVGSFIDFMLINELSKNIDGYRLSTFLHKDKGDKLKAGPIWDFNLAYGNADYYNGWSPYDFQINAKMPNDGWANPFWWPALWADTAFVNQMKCRWNDLRKDQWSDSRIVAITDSLVAGLGDAVARNFERWPVLGMKVWPNYYVGSTYSDEVSWMKGWLNQRLFHLDSRLPGKCGGTLPSSEKKFAVSVYPNPMIHELKVKIVSPRLMNIRLRLYNATGSVISDEQFPVAEGEEVITIDTRALPRGMYIYEIIKGSETVSKGKVVKL